MMYSYRIEQAIRAASVLHREQSRKGTAPYPYVAHVFAVACIIADYTEDEDIIIAGLLHDTLEDTDYTEEELQTDFGSRVRAIVVGVSERTDPNDSRPWYERKSDHLTTLETASNESLMVCAADIIHNLRSIVEEYQTNMADYLSHFGGTLEDRLFFYKMKSDLLNQRLENPIMHEFNHVYNEYREFIRSEA